MPNAVGTNEIGPSFGAELGYAGLGGLAFTWGTDGTFAWGDLTDDRQAAVEAVYADHDPNRSAPPGTISDRQFAQQAALTGLISEKDALAWASAGKIPPSMLALVNELPGEAQFAAKMMLSGATSFERSHALTAELTAAFGWSDRQRDDFWSAAAQL